MSAERERAPVDPAARTGRRSQVARYGLWQLRDYLLDRGAPTVIVLTIFGGLQVAPMLAILRGMARSGVGARMLAQYGTTEAAIAATRHEMGTHFVSGFLGAIVTISALFAMQGIVSNDRKQGFFRFLFAKPVSPSRYYGQAFAIHGVANAGLVMLLFAVYGRFMDSVVTGAFVVAFAGMWCCYAGMTFLFSASAKFDWLALVAVMMVATLAWGRWATSTSPLAKLLYLLPPMHRTDEVYQAMGQARALPWHLLGWFAGYGAICYLLALLVLRHRRLAIP